MKSVSKLLHCSLKRMRSGMLTTRLNTTSKSKKITSTIASKSNTWRTNWLNVRLKSWPHKLAVLSKLKTCPTLTPKKLKLVRHSSATAINLCARRVLNRTVRSLLKKPNKSYFRKWIENRLIADYKIKRCKSSQVSRKEKLRQCW